jgi:hypothetical protein
MRYPKWSPTLLMVILLGPGSFKAVADPSVFSADGFFHTITQIAERSGPRISSLISRSYPEFPSDIAELVGRKYPSLRDEVYVDLDNGYPGLYKEALEYIRRESPSTYEAHRKDVIKRKKDLLAGRVGPSDLLWARLEKDPALKTRLMGELDKKHPEIKFKILSRIDKQYPALKIDLYSLILTQYPDMVWDVAKIAAAEAVDGSGRP